MKRKSLISFLLICVLAVSLIGCGTQQNDPSKEETKQAASDTQKDKNNKETEKINLKLDVHYANESEQSKVDYAVEEMKKIMPEVEVEIIPTAVDDGQKIKTLAAAGNLPDIYTAKPSVIEIFKKSDNVLELDSYIKELNIEGQLLQTVKSIMYNEDGHVYAMPSYAPQHALLYYNKEVFEKYGVKPPTNFDEMMEVIKVFNENEIIPLALFAQQKWPGVTLFDMIATRENPVGIEGLNKGNIKMSDEAYTKAAEKLITMVKAGLLGKGAFNTRYEDALNQFVTGKAAMLVNGNWATVDCGKQIPGKAGLLFPYPFADAGKEEDAKWAISGGGLGGANLAVSPYSENKDVAAKYAILFSLKMGEGAVIQLGEPPMVVDALQPNAPRTEIVNEYIDAVPNFKTTTVFPWGINNPKLSVTLEDNVHKLLTGEYPVEDFVKAVDKAIEEEVK